MIELNLTYEESKKILELGYDFSSICREFEHKPTNSKKIKINENIFIEENVNIGSFDEAYPVRAVKSLLEFGFIPLIPKAALKACLPRNLDHHPYSSHLVCRLEKLGYRRNGKEYPYINFNSAFEAFLWLHENYPEELKKKFDEVMG
jgi:hypothetical protein